MNTEELWAVVADQRRQIAAFLGGLEPDEWNHPTLCDRWTVKDVAAHLAVVPHAPSVPRTVFMVVRARGDADQVNHDIACTYAAQRTPSELMTELQGQATDRRLPGVTTLKNLAMDLVAHGQDMAIPLGRALPVDPAAALSALRRAWTMGWPWYAARRLAGYRLVATDADWTQGQGEEIRGPALSLLLLATGREPSVLPGLEGAGLARLAQA